MKEAWLKECVSLGCLLALVAEEVLGTCTCFRTLLSAPGCNLASVPAWNKKAGRELTRSNVVDED